MQVSLNNYNAMMNGEYGWDQNNVNFQFNLTIEDAIADPEEVVNTLHREMENMDIAFGDAYYGVMDPAARAILVAEAINWAAKTTTAWWYEVKAAACQAALSLGAFGYIEDDEYGNSVLYLYSKEVGTASFHFPFGQECWDMTGPNMHWGKLNGRFPWSGITRQEVAFELLTDSQVLKLYAWATRPRSLSYPGLPQTEKVQKQFKLLTVNKRDNPAHMLDQQFKEIEVEEDIFSDMKDTFFFYLNFKNRFGLDDYCKGRIINNKTREWIIYLESAFETEATWDEAFQWLNQQGVIIHTLA